MDTNKEFLLNILRQLPGHVYVKDRNGVYLAANDREEISEKAENFIGKKDTDFSWKDQADILRSHDKQVMSSQQEHKMLESGKQADGLIHTYYSNKKPYYNEKGELAGIIGCSLDITDLLDSLSREYENKQVIIKGLKEPHNPTQVTVLVTLKAKSGKEKELKEHIRQSIPLSRSIEGCINYDVHQSLEDPALFVVYMNWKNKEAHNKYLNSDYIQKFIRQDAEQLLEYPDKETFLTHLVN